MERTITVQGLGQAHTSPDLILIPISLSARSSEYDQASSLGAQQLEDLRQAMLGAGFRKDDLKTSYFNVATEYENEYDKNGNCHQRFRGYRCDHQLTLRFDLDLKHLSDVLQALAQCPAAPQFSVQFTVRDPDALCAQMLASAAENARAKAAVLCEASGVRLGQLLNIRYSWENCSFNSPTRFAVAEDCLMSKCLDVVPEDIDTQDTVTFIWELL